MAIRIPPIRPPMTTITTGSIMDVKADEEIIGAKDVPDIEKLHPLVFSPVSRRYHAVGSFVGEAFSMGKKYRTKLSK